MSFLWHDLQRIVNHRPHRYFGVLFSEGFHAVALYRVDRCLYLIFGRGWKIARLCMAPLFFLLRPWFSGCEIHYEAEIGRGILILHGSLGVVVTGKAVIGKNITFTGGNCLCTKGARLSHGDVAIGDNVLLGANAVVLGPIRIGDRAVISACSVAMRDIGEGEIVGGIPAKLLIVRGSPQ